MVVPASQTGWYNHIGEHDAGNPNYAAGDLFPYVYRNFFVFDLSAVGGLATAGVLRLASGQCWYTSPDASETYTLYDVSTPTSTLIASSSVATAIFADLGTGAVFGDRVITAADGGTVLEIPLNAAGVAAVNGGIGGSFAIGGAVTTLGSPLNELVLGCSEIGVRELALTGTTSCGNAIAEAGEQCDDGNVANGDCCSSTCQYEPDSTPCPSDGMPCSIDICNATGTCTHNASPFGSPCRAAAGVCDLAESCDGSSIACPADAKSTALCRPVADVCDGAESCDGINDGCPADANQPDDTACDDLDTCTQTDTCQSGICTGADPLDCDDGNACSTDSCDPMGGCVNDDSPAIGCLVSGKSIVLIKDNATDDSKDKLLWKWIKGAELNQVDLADPTSSASYALCVYAGTTNALIADATLPPVTGWSAIGTRGYKFKGTSPNGLSLAILKGGAAGKSKALAKGKGTALPDPTLPVVYPVTVQLKKVGSPLCLESTFIMADEKKNTDTQFKAKQ